MRTTAAEREVEAGGSRLALSVILCTHNPRTDYLARALAGLRAQTLATSDWELLVVDNASSTPVRPLVDLHWHPGGRVVREETLGLMHARARGVRESRGEILCFVDDDNVLDRTYLHVAREIFSTHGMLGAIGAARIDPEFEEEPAPELAPYLIMLALRRGERRWSNDPEDWHYPWGAGLTVRRGVALEVAGLVNSNSGVASLDRKGADLTSCGDDIFSWVACKQGLGRGVFDTLRLTHLISRSRVQRDYLLRLAEAMAFSRVLILQINARPYVPSRPEMNLSRVWQLILQRRIRTLLREAYEAVRCGFMHEPERAFTEARRRGALRAERLATGGPASVPR